MINQENAEELRKNLILIDLPEDYWEFIGNNLPKYERRDDVLHSDIMERFVDDELYDEDDLSDMEDLLNSYGGSESYINLNKENALLVSNKLNTELYIEALQSRIEELEEIIKNNSANR